MSVLPSATNLGEAIAISLAKSCSPHPLAYKFLKPHVSPLFSFSNSALVLVSLFHIISCPIRRPSAAFPPLSLTFSTFLAFRDFYSMFFVSFFPLSFYLSSFGPRLLARILHDSLPPRTDFIVLTRVSSHNLFFLFHNVLPL